MAIHYKLCGCVLTCLGGGHDHEPRVAYCATHGSASEALELLRAFTPVETPPWLPEGRVAALWKLYQLPGDDYVRMRVADMLREVMTERSEVVETARKLLTRCTPLRQS